MGLEQRIVPGTNPRISRVVSKSDSDHGTATTAHRTLGLTPAGAICHSNLYLWRDFKIPTYKPHTNHKKPSVSSHTLAPTTICDLTHSICRSPLTDLGHKSSVTYVCHPLGFVCGHRKGILTSPLTYPNYKSLMPLFFFRVPFMLLDARFVRVVIGIDRTAGNSLRVTQIHSLTYPLSLYSTATQNTWRRGWRWAVAPTPEFCVGDTNMLNAKICVTPDAKPQRQPVEYSLSLVLGVGSRVGHVHFIFFVSISFAFGSVFPVEYGLNKV